MKKRTNNATTAHFARALVDLDRDDDGHLTFFMSIPAAPGLFAEDVLVANTVDDVLERFWDNYCQSEEGWENALRSDIDLLIVKLQEMKEDI